jgi:peptide/nickel transport system permease protein
MSRWTATTLNSRPALAVIVILLLASGMAAQGLQDGAASATSSARGSAVQDEPVANAGANLTVFVGQIVFFNASGSTVHVQPANYTWVFTFKNDSVALYGVVVNRSFSEPGEAFVNLTVTDGLGRSDSDQITVSVVPIPKTFLGQYGLTLLGLAILMLIVGPVAVRLIGRIIRGEPLILETEKEKARLLRRHARKFWKQYRKNSSGMLGLSIMIAFVAIAILAPLLVTVDNPNHTDSIEQNVLPDWTFPHPPSLTPSPYTGWTHPLGTDHRGFDVYSMTLYGTRASLIVGLFASLISAVLGASIGIGAGYLGRISDELLMRLTDFFLVIPWFPFMIVLFFVLGPGFLNVIIVIGIVSWPSTARIVRAQVLSLKERVFIERVRSIGGGDTRIVGRHILPNIMPLIFANTVLLVANSIFMEAFLDFFGFGDPDVISWGTMLEQAYSHGGFSSTAWWPILPPGFCIVLLVMSFYLIGDAVDDIINPRLRRR